MSETNQSLESFWMPFIGIRVFKKNPRLVARANGMFFSNSRKPDGGPRFRGDDGAIYQQMFS